MSTDHAQASPIEPAGKAGEHTGRGHEGRLLVFFHDPAQACEELKSSLISKRGALPEARSASIFEARGGAPAAELQAVLDADEQTRMVIVYPNPATALALELSEGVRPELALSNWKKSTALPLGLFRQNRRRVMLLDGHAAISDSAGLDGIWRQYTGLAPGPAVAPGGDERAEGLELAWFAAQHLLHHDHEASLLVAELEAGSLPLTLSRNVDIEGLLEQWHAGGVSAQHELLQLQADNELLLLQLQQVQAELESYCTANRELQARLESNDSSKAKKLQGNISELHEQLKWAQHDLAEIRQSLSWKITAPLRGVFGLLKRG